MIGSVIGQLVGMLSAGYVLSKKKPRASYVCFWNVMGSFILVVGLYGISHTSCDRAPWILKNGDSYARKERSNLFTRPIF